MLSPLTHLIPVVARIHVLCVVLLFWCIVTSAQGQILTTAAVCGFREQYATLHEEEIAAILGVQQSLERIRQANEQTKGKNNCSRSCALPDRSRVCLRTA